METFMGHLLPALASEGVEVRALVHAHGQGSASPPEGNLEPGVQVIRAPAFGRPLYAPVSPQFPLWLRRSICDFRPELLHLHVPDTSAFWALLLAGAKRIPWVIQWQSDVAASRHDRRLGPAYRLYRPLERRLLAHSRCIVASSPSYLASSTTLAPWRECCRVIPLGLDSERLARPSPADMHRAAQQWGVQRGRVLAVGRLTYYKGHEHLVRAAALAPGLRVLIVGDGERGPALRELIARLGLERRVTLLGHLPEAELAALMADCDCLCLPSIERTESFGMVLLEAMSWGRAVVASDVPGSGMGWVVQDGRTGLLTRPGDAEGLAAALQRLAEDAQLRARLGAAGQARFRNCFSIDVIARQFRDLYRELAAGGQAPE
jgi:glycosyltransferase involved in cell wall biosynthesis